MKSAILLAPQPPPVHGQSIMVRQLAESSRDWKEVRLYAIDARFADSLSELQALTIRKIFRLCRYLLRMVAGCLTKRARVVVLTPAFYKGPFLKDSVFIWTAWLLGRRVVAWFHMDFSHMDRSSLPEWFLWWMKLTLRRCRACVCCAPALVQSLPDFLDRAKIHPLENGIPDPGPPDRPPPGAKARFLYLSNFVTTKGWRELLQAAETVCSRHPEAEFDFFGGASWDFPEEQLRNTFAACVFPDRIRYRGFADESTKRQAFAAADVFCFPTYSEGFPLVLLEAMAAGLPVIATAVGGIVDALKVPEGGWLVDPRSASALQAAIESALASREVWPEMGGSNRLRFLNCYSVERFSQRWEDFMEKVVS